MTVRRVTVAAATLALVGAGLTAAAPTTAQAATSVPRFDHIVLVIFENKASSQITASSAPYFQSLAAQGASFSQSYAITHPSQPNYIALLIVTFDEDNSLSLNHIHTTFVGAGVSAGTYSEKITHYTVLRTIESAYGLAALGSAASVSPITDVWS
ncbi:alkaline phosphatase family protein [Actinoplanes sp. KI2]|uniref:alkaline phosphatase family protein n=1 Tax=Actinoplanes sp. KI2 TaxID=2983315 RepID=UPI0021D5DB2F|nr:alkaline phosphatase family protein [Actinoplanes sp. KI2]MCU7722601.1 alkaline phosphatase family protein [Actinoplanes sp. KI2]